MIAQLDLFGAPPASDTPSGGERPAESDAEVRRLSSRLSPRIRLGISSWAFSGRAGAVRARAQPGHGLSENALATYARHPLLRTAGIDRSFFAPIDEAGYARLAVQVPGDFRFVVKAPQSLTTAYCFESREPSAHFLDPVAARDLFVEPCLAGLGAATGPLVFLFPPQGRDATRDPAAFAARLGRFLRGLPSGPLYAVELRDRKLLGAHTIRALAATGVRLCLSVHARMPPIQVQAAAATSLGPGPLVVRWNLHSGFASALANARHAPADRLVDEDQVTRARIALLCRDCVDREQDAWVIANDKAQSCAPHPVERLARAIVDTGKFPVPD